MRPAGPPLTGRWASPRDGWQALAAIIDQDAVTTAEASLDWVTPLDDDSSVNLHDTETAHGTWQAGAVPGTSEAISFNPSRRGLAEPFTFRAAAGPVAPRSRVEGDLPSHGRPAGLLAARPEPAAIALAGLGGIAMRRWRRT